MIMVNCRNTSQGVRLRLLPVYLGIIVVRQVPSAQGIVYGEDQAPGISRPLESAGQEVLPIVGHDSIAEPSN